MSKHAETIKVLKKVRRGKITHHPAKGSASAHFTIAGRMFHPDQRVYISARREGYISVSSDGTVTLTEIGHAVLEDDGTRYSECERVTASPTSPTHLRIIEHGEEPVTGGGLKEPALCGAEVAWDIGNLRLSRAEIIVRSKGQHETFRYCSGCLSAVTGKVAISA